jgi:hypothetical protein
LNENTLVTIIDTQDENDRFETDIDGVRDFIRNHWQDDEEVDEAFWEEIGTADIERLDGMLEGIGYYMEE